MAVVGLIEYFSRNLPARHAHRTRKLRLGLCHGTTTLEALSFFTQGPMQRE